MTLRREAVGEALAPGRRFDAIVDARSESEFALDHLPGAVNWPTLNDAERHEVGRQYCQESPFEARKRGAAMAARNIARHLEREGPALSRQWRPLVYCWRGGQRSGALALILSQVGFEVTVLEGGYRAFRRQVIDELEQLPSRLDWRVISGRTGSAKSRLLGAIAADGGQVLDLEGLAAHRGSVLGGLDSGQPGQKAFETRLWSALRGLDPRHPVHVESESRTIGRLRVPDALLTAIRAAPCVHVQMPLAARIEFLIEDYAHLRAQPEHLCERLGVLREIRGAAVVERWQTLARAGQWPALVAELLEQHYDPIYLKSMRQNFARFDQAPVVQLADASPAALAAAARQLTHNVPADRGTRTQDSVGTG